MRRRLLGGEDGVDGDDGDDRVTPPADDALANLTRLARRTTAGTRGGGDLWWAATLAGSRFGDYA